MNKETFLEELRGYLRILEDQEQEDILEEYAQHIDIKLQKGLSEEEAIRDFGPMKELAAEILEAYHVKPEFQEKKSAIRMPDLKRSRIADIGNHLKAKAGACVQGIKRGFGWMGRKCHQAADWFRKLFSGRKVRETGEQETSVREAEEPKTDGSRRAEKRPENGYAAAFARGITRLWRFCIAFLKWWLRLFWNLLWLFMALFFGTLAVIMLAGFGMGLILLPQGYPLAGVLILCVGGILSLGALCCGSFSLMIRRKREEPEAEEEEEESGKEAAENEQTA